MTWPSLILRIAIYALLVVPAVLSAWIWRRTFGRPRMPALHRASLVVVTLSSALLALGILFRDVIGSAYSDQRFATIWINLGLALLAALSSALVRGEQRRMLVVAGVWLTFAWYFVAVMSSIV